MFSLDWRTEVGDSRTCRVARVFLLCRVTAPLSSGVFAVWVIILRVGWFALPPVRQLSAGSPFAFAVGTRSSQCAAGVVRRLSGCDKPMGIEVGQVARLRPAMADPIESESQMSSEVGLRCRIGGRSSVRPGGLQRQRNVRRRWVDRRRCDEGQHGLRVHRHDRGALAGEWQQVAARSVHGSRWRHGWMRRRQIGHLDSRWWILMVDNAIVARQMRREAAGR